MMEVKQNTAVDLNELLVPPKSVDGVDELDDAIMTDLSEEAVSQDLNCDIINPIEKPNNGLVMTNGDGALSSIMEIDGTESASLDEEAPVSTEMEDALLAEDDVVVPNVDATKIISDTAPSVAEEDLLADKVETSNSTTSSSNDRDPGDDLDTLLSKINDIVDDCLDKDSEPKAVPGVISTPAKTKNTAEDVSEAKKESAAPLADTECANLDESVIIVEDPTDENDEKQVDEVENTRATAMSQEQDLKKDSDKECKSEAEQTEKPSVENNEDLQKSAKVDLTKSTENDKNEHSIEEIQTDTKSVNREEEKSEPNKSIKDKSVPPDTITLSPSKEQPAIEESSNEIVEKKPEVSATDEDAGLLPNKETTEKQLSNEEKTQQTSLTEDDDADVIATENIEEKKSENIGPEKPEEIEEATKPEVDAGNKEKQTVDNDNKLDNKEDNEDSDDEIVFYVDEKEQEAKNGEDKLPNVTDADVSVEEIPEQTNKEAAKPTTDDDDVVILDDDDETPEVSEKKAEGTKEVSEQGNKSVDAEEKVEKTTEADANESIEQTAQKHTTNLDVDNSDNARDEFVTDKSTAAATGDSTATAATSTESSKRQEMEETNSNCSSSSNLLLEAKANENSGDDANQDDNDNDAEEEDDDGDVELIENESKEAENSSEKGEEFAPPAKRQRLSEDSQVSSNIDESSNKSLKGSELSDEKLEAQAETTQQQSASTSLKRPHDVIELEVDDKSNDSKTCTNTETLTKKVRTEGKIQEESKAANEDEKVEFKAPKEDEEKVVDRKSEFKNVIPSYKPIPLYPPPKLDTLKSQTTMSLDFLKKFRKSFDKMTKQDLEEMVLQKVVEAIIHKSEFAEMRELLEKQEKLIATHRTKITELSKQFRDLEMVHNRVVKDIEQRNSQFIMPVKITRAVGLQVYIPNKKTIMEPGTTSSSMIPSSSPQRPISTASSQSSLTSPQRPIPPSAAPHSAEGPPRPSSSLSSAFNATITNAVRRGCVQKITPTRPVPGSSSNSAPNSAAGTPGAAPTYRTNLNQSQTSAQPRILNKNASTSTGSAGIPSSANQANLQRNRFAQSNMESVRLQQQQQQQQQSAASRTAPSGQRVVPQKPITANTVVPRRSDPGASVTSTNNSSSLDTYMNTLSQLTGGNTAVSITPAKPKEKAVIDLTDEDELAPATPAANATSSLSASNGPATNQPQRRSLITQTNNANSTTQFARNAPPLARIPPINQAANSNKSRQTAVSGQKTSNSSFSSTISTPPGTSITRINVSANSQNSQRVKYSHPAPLPATPPQAFNPSWKLPPPRPTIRISNLDNGIVISWTMEESMDRHAECVSYQIYAYQETSGPPMADSWRHVGDVKAMLLPMAVTLTQFQEGQRYFFAVRAVDCHQRYGPFSLPKTWS